MNIALALARRGLGNVWPNPAVGCIIVRDGRVVGRGWTQPSGRPHAETEALAQAGHLAAGATAYVSLEPCSHTGETPPCASALIDAGIGKIVVAIEDPDLRVRGNGTKMIRAAGIEVLEGIQQEQAARLNAGFISRVTRDRPAITLKLATTLDGRIATRTGQSQWITGQGARDAAHGLRARHDAILVGSGTVLSDDPALTCRLPGLSMNNPVRIVLDGRLRTSTTHQLVLTASDTPTWIITREDHDPDNAAKIRKMGAEILIAPTNDDDHIDVSWTVQELADRGLTRVLIEGGAAVAGAFVGADLVDEISWFRASSIIGGDGRTAIDGFELESLDHAPKFEHTGTVEYGTDSLATYLRNR